MAWNGLSDFIFDIPFFVFVGNLKHFVGAKVDKSATMDPSISDYLVYGLKLKVIKSYESG